LECFVIYRSFVGEDFAFVYLVSEFHLVHDRFW